MGDSWTIIGRGIRTGVIAGVVGTAVMTVSEKLEQRLTGRPNSFIPAHTLERMLGLKTEPDDQRQWLQWVAHWGVGILPAALRGVMAEGGMRGPLASAMFFVTRVTTDETMENVTGVGKPPWSWPTKLGAVDLGHKAVYAFATGAVADKLAKTPPPLAQRSGGHGSAGSF